MENNVAKRDTSARSRTANSPFKAVSEFSGLSISYKSIKRSSGQSETEL